jgi:signal transduction histidine kinase
VIPALFKRNRFAKLSLFISGLVIVIITVLYTNYLSQRLAENERNNAGLFAKAIIKIEQSDDPDIETELHILITYSKRIPIILENEMGELKGYNFGERRNDDPEYLRREREKLLRSGFEPIEGEGYASLIYYKNSFLLTLIKWFPLVQVLLIVVFIMLGYFSLNSARKAEQNMVWVGMAKETAHQLGTPISAILGWIEYLKTLMEKEEQQEVIGELRNDIGKLELIADRFSKIGSAPKLESMDLHSVLRESVEYMHKRSSRKVEFLLPQVSNPPIQAHINKHLFSWVIENLFRNALDALGGEGKIKIHLEREKRHVIIDIEDTGKGIPSGKLKKVFEPGYTTKKRGWGLGLSLAKRIIEEYHKGKIFVKKSEVDQGTTFRILLPRND